MPHTPHEFLDAARRAIPEVSVEDVAARRTRGDDFILLDVREKEEVRAGYIEGAITIPRGGGVSNELIYDSDSSSICKAIDE